MSALGLVSSESTRPNSAEFASGLQFRFDDTLASGKRLWLRGQLLGSVPGSLAQNTEPRAWWRRWLGNDGLAYPLPSIQLRIQLGTGSISADATLHPDGRFEAKMNFPLPAARRGWRVARIHATLGANCIEACNVVLVPSTQAASAVVVLLPQECGLDPDGLRGLATSKWSRFLEERLAQLLHGSGAHNPIFYVFGVPAEGPHRQAELALAATAAGWPPGHFLPIPVRKEGMPAALVDAIESFRWLFASSLDLQIINLEPRAASLPIALREPAEEWAVVRRLIQLDSGNGRPPSEAHAHRSGPRSSGLRPTRGVLVPRSPVVFCHGMLAFSMLKMQMPEDLNCFAPLREFLRDRGFQVLFPQVPPTSGVAERAECLRDQIRAWTAEPVNIVAHSMGGLDARYMITHLGMGEQVRTLTAVSTPHRGTALAEWFLNNFRRRVPFVLALETLGVSFDGFRDCQPQICQEFNTKTPDHPRVRYFSVGGEVSPGHLAPALRRAWNILWPIEGPNDGMVSVASSRWGEYLETVHADHFAQTPDAVFLRAGEDFDSLGYYTRLVENLARLGY